MKMIVIAGLLPDYRWPREWLQQLQLLSRLPEGSKVEISFSRMNTYHQNTVQDILPTSNILSMSSRRVFSPATLEDSISSLITCCSRPMHAHGLGRDLLSLNDISIILSFSSSFCLNPQHNISEIMGIVKPIQSLNTSILWSSMQRQPMDLFKRWLIWLVFVREYFKGSCVTSSCTFCT